MNINCNRKIKNKKGKSVGYRGEKKGKGSKNGNQKLGVYGNDHPGEKDRIHKVLKTKLI